MKMKKHFKRIWLLLLALSLTLIFAACDEKNQIPDGTYVPHEETARAYFAEMEEYAGEEALNEQMEYFIEAFTLRIEGGKFIYGTSKYAYELNSDGSVTFPNGEIADDTFTCIDGKLIMSYEGLVVEMVKQ